MGNASNAGKPVCYIVSYDHGGLVLWGYDHFVEHLRGLLGWLDRHPRFKSGLDNEAWMYDWLAGNQPAVLHELRDSIRKYAGRLGIATCTYGQPLAAYILDESNIRQIRMGLETVRERLDYDLDIYSFSEHAAFAQLPQILSQLGVRGALMRTHYLMYGHCPGYDLPIAWWEGPDGSRVPCVPSYVHQERQVAGHRAHPAGPYGLTTEDTWILTRYPSDISPRPLDSFAKRFSHIRPLLATRIDDSGLKREALVTELDSRDEFRWATLEDVFDEFPKPQATIAPTSEDFGTRMPWGYRGNELFDLARTAEVTLLSAERLVATAAPEYRLAHLEAQLKQAWKDALVAQHHDIQIVGRAGPMGRERLIASLERSRGIIRELLCERQSDPNDFVLFNPLPWKRQEPYAVLPDFTPLPGRATGIAMGLSAFRPDLDRAEPAELSFQTDAYDVVMSPAGGIDSLRTRDGQNLLLPGRRAGCLAAVIDGAEHTSSGTAKAWRSAAGFSVIETGKIGPLPYTITWLFPHDGARIEYSVRVRFNGERIGEPTEQTNDSRSGFVHEKKLRACFSPAIEQAGAVGIYDVPFGYSTTQRPYVEGNFWTALADKSGGLAIFNRGTMGSCREESGAFSVPLAFSTHYIWGDEIICGNREWRLGLLPFRGRWEDQHLHHQALEFAFPMMAVPGTLGSPAHEAFTIDNPEVHLTAFYPENGERYLRLYNGSAREQAISIPQSAIRTDLRHREIGQPAGPTLRLGAWEISTIKLPR